METNVIDRMDIKIRLFMQAKPRQVELERKMFFVYKIRRCFYGNEALADEGMQKIFSLTAGQVIAIKRYLEKAQGNVDLAWAMFRKANGYKYI